MKPCKRTAILAAMAVFAIAAVFIRLATWTQHSDNLFMAFYMPLMFPVCAVMGIIHIVKCIRAKAWIWMVLGLVAIAVCLWGARTYMKIPTCLECDGGVTKEELGWMARWFFDS